jgi:hypothetical protein
MFHFTSLEYLIHEGVHGSKPSHDHEDQRICRDGMILNGKFYYHLGLVSIPDQETTGIERTHNSQERGVGVGVGSLCHGGHTGS